MKPNIRQYTDYRQFIEDYFQYRKASNPNWSYRSWAKHLGIKSNASLLKIVNGEREIGDSILTKLVDYFSFSENETLYFEDLVKLSKFKKDLRLSNLIFDNLAKEHTKTKHHHILADEFKDLSNWIYFIISSLASGPGLPNNAAWICDNFKFKSSKEEIQTIITDMLDRGLIHLSEDKSTLISSGLALRAYEGLSKNTEDMKKIHLQLIDIAKECILDHKPGDKSIILHGFSLNISHSDIQLINEKIYNFFDKLTQEFSVANFDSAYQFQLQCFSVTKN